VNLGRFSRLAGPNNQADKTAFVAGNIDISQARAKIPCLPAPL
jgi:hypothetical protein